MTDNDAQNLQKYMAETKRALKSMSKNQLIAAVSALLLDKHALVNEINRLTSQNGVLNVTANPAVDDSVVPALDSASE